MNNKKDKNNALEIQNGPNGISRRELLKAAGMSAIVATTGLNKDAFAGAGENQASALLKGNIKHSVCRWCYDKISIENLAENCVRIGVKSIAHPSGVTPIWGHAPIWVE